MASFRLSEKAELELDEIWLFTARESASVEIATVSWRASIAALDFSPRILTPVAAATMIYALACAVFPRINT